MSATFLREYLSEVQQQLSLTSQNLHTLEENLHEIIKIEDGHLAYFYKTLADATIRLEKVKASSSRIYE